MQNSIPELITENLFITVLKAEDFHLLAAYERNNQQHLSQWEPSRNDGYFSVNEVKKRVESHFANFIAGSAIALVGLNKERSKIICACHFTNIVLGVFQACHLGYSINMQDQGKGLMFEMLNVSIGYVYAQYGLHRIMANYMPGRFNVEVHNR
ncbi:MAG: ribosomal-protein-alanine N-acetyltransferase [Psychromonas sp.]|jgi:ribosomal-protein-alanine N-acetyltransferase|uniref:GNAT family N-acetyltransferase n=1 Tax=Psychromonas sp. TaxID=1884585 RepID=UPI0039E4DEFE